MNRLRASNHARSTTIPWALLALWGFTLALCGSATAASPQPASQPTLDFGRDIRPLLSSHCFQCHGPDAEHREADLRLDVRAAAFSEQHNAIVPGDLQASEAWQRIISDDPDTRMPPADAEHQLDAKQRDLIRRWILQGANWTEHWAFVAPQRPTLPGPPTNSDDEHRSTPSQWQQDWPQGAIDRFVAASLQTQRLQPAPAADRTTWLRRVSLDLTGLPPSVAELDAFLADQSPQAKANVVERLLRSPHYGERWARVWLDAARYSDSDGYEKDKPREVWFYRDWVINAFNEDLPYDQFVIQQIAGDLLPGATQRQRVATGFLRNSMINEEGGADPEQFRMEAMFDRMDAVGKAILGLTINCAQCHSHKYDPISQQEYYQLFACLNNSHEAALTVYTPKDRQRIDTLHAKIDQLDQQLREGTPGWQTRYEAWQQQQRERQKQEPDWQIPELSFNASSIGGQKFLRYADGSYLAAGYAPTKFQPQMTLKVAQPRITALRLEMLTDPNLPRQGPGRSIEGTAALTELIVHWASPDEPDKWHEVKFASATANIHPTHKSLKKIYSDLTGNPRPTGPVEYAIDGDYKTAWTTDIGYGRSNQSSEAIFVLAKPLELQPGSRLRVQLSQMHGGWNSDDNQTFNLGRFRIGLADAENPKVSPLPPELRAICELPAKQRTRRQEARLFAHWRAAQQDWAVTHQEIEKLWADEHPAGTTQLVLQERAKPRTTSLLQRGDFLSPQQTVQAGTPGFMPQLDPRPGEAPRLALARWLVRRDAPTTARAIVNRIWQAYFGKGFVETADDLGSQSTPPTHPQLLDWLAVELMESGWRLKHLHRLIALSATYGQSSHADPQQWQRDPYNRWLARGPRFRVDAELVRDITLSASGLLNPQVGGPSVYPPAPEFLFKPPVSYGPKVWNEAKGPQRYRRGMYTFRFRSVPFPMLETFDAPPGLVSCVRRSRSNTPLQALTSLNEPLFMETARALGKMAYEQFPAESQLDEGIIFIYRRCCARRPNDKERRVLSDYWRQQHQRLADGQLDAKAIVGEQADQQAGTDLAAWTLLARVVLNLDETITKE